MTPEALLALFDDAAAAVKTAIDRVPRTARSDRTERPGQYALDLVADAAACAVLERAAIRIVSEESGVHERASGITVVLDPVDGSTNCSRGISYWATSICAVDGDGPLAALVVNQATGQSTRAIRGDGATRDDEKLRASSVTRVEDAVVYLSGAPSRPLAWKQFRALGSGALGLCDVAAGGLDGFVDAYDHAPWDYLGGLLACTEAGAIVRDARGEAIVTTDPNARRQLLAAGTPELLDALAEAVT